MTTTETQDIVERLRHSANVLGNYDSEWTPDVATMRAAAAEIERLRSLDTMHIGGLRDLVKRADARIRELEAEVAKLRSPTESKDCVFFAVPDPSFIGVADPPAIAWCQTHDRPASRCQSVTEPTWPEWRPIETAPRDGTYILIFEGNAITAAWWTSANPRLSGWDAGEFMCDHPTHWLPLPPPPGETT